MGNVISEAEREVYTASLHEEMARIVDLPLPKETGHDKQHTYPTIFRFGIGKDLTADSALKQAAKKAGNQSRRNPSAFIPLIQRTHIVIDLLEEAVFEEITSEKEGTITRKQIFSSSQ